MFFQHPESILLFTGTGPQFLTNNEPLASSNPPSLLFWPLIGLWSQPRPLIGWAWPSLVSHLVPGYPGLALVLSRHSASYYRQQNTVTSLSKSKCPLVFRCCESSSYSPNDLDNKNSVLPRAAALAHPPLSLHRVRWQMTNTFWILIKRKTFV